MAFLVLVPGPHWTSARALCSLFRTFCLGLAAGSAAVLPKYRRLVVWQALDYVGDGPTVYGAMWLSSLDLFTHSPVRAQVCFDRPVQTVLNPCGHEALCKRVRDGLQRHPLQGKSGFGH